MELQHDSTISGALALSMRKREALSQKAFWGPIGVGQCVGSHYENERYGIPSTVQKLLYLFYVPQPSVKRSIEKMKRDRA